MNAMTKIGILKDADLFRQQALIGGIWRDADTKAAVDVIDPASLSVLGTVPDMGGDETRAAIDAAAEAFKSWKKKTHAERAGLLERWHDLMLRARRGPGAPADAGAGQAACRGAWRKSATAHLL